MIALVEAVDRDGSVRQAWRVDAWPVRIGRALDNDVVLSDPFVAGHHATLQPGADGGLEVVAAETRNGLTVGHGRQARRVGQGETLRVAAVNGEVELHAGRTLLRVRLADAPLVDERLLLPTAGAGIRWPVTLLLLVAVLAAVAFQTWLSQDPDALVRALAGTLIAALAVQLFWAGAWALLSKLFARQSQFGWHLRVAVVAGLVLIAGNALAALVAFVFDVPWATDYAFVFNYAVIAGAVYGHLIAVEPQRRGLMRGVAIAGFAAAVGLAVWFNVQRTGRAGEELYMSHLFPPALRWATPQTVDRFTEGLAPLQAGLDREARRKPDGDDDDLGDIVGN